MASTSRGMKEEKTMPVELAIQRELAYRRKIAALRLRRNTNSTKQVKPSNQVPHLIPLSDPSSRPFSSSNLSGTKRKEFPTSSAHHSHPRHEQPFHCSLNQKAISDDLYCTICQLSCTSPFNLKQHLIGHKHKGKLQELECETGGREGRSQQRQWCEICNVSCMNEDLLKLHFQGQKHKAKLQKINKQDGEDPNKQQKWCEVCKLWCINEFSFNQHLQGKKHIIKMHAMEKEKE